MSACYSSGSTQDRYDDGIVLDSVIQCPHCGTSKTERMPVDACQIVYECTGRGIKLRPPADYPIFWHKADIAAVLSDVAFGGNAHNLIRASHVPCGRLVRLTLGLHRAQ